MKRLVNKRTGEVAILDPAYGRISFSNSKGTYKAFIEEDPISKKISKISTSAEPISAEPIKNEVEIDNEPISDVIEIEPINENLNPICLQTPAYIMSVADKLEIEDQKSDYYLEKKITYKYAV